MGNTVTAVSTNRKKEATARELGADHFVVSTEPESFESANRSLDLVLNTISGPHQVANYFPLMKRNGTVVQLGAVFEPMQVKCLTQRQFSKNPFFKVCPFSTQS